MRGKGRKGEGIVGRCGRVEQSREGRNGRRWEGLRRGDGRVR